MTRCSWLTVLAVAFALPARAGLLMEFEEGPRRTTVEMEGNRFRSSETGPAERHASGPGPATTKEDEDADAAPPEGEEGEGAPMPGAARRAHRDVTVFDGAKQVLYQVDEDQKVYQRTDEGSVAEMAKALDEAAAKMRAKLTPEQRAQMDAYMAGQKKAEPGPKVVNHTWKFERAGGSERVAGYTCQWHRVLRDGKPTMQACFIAWGTGGFTQKDFQALQDLGRFVEKLQRGMRDRFGQGQGPAASGDWMTRFVETAPGFPAVIKDLERDGAGARDMRLVKIERASIPATRFAIPADYREKKFSVPFGE